MVFTYIHTIYFALLAKPTFRKIHDFFFCLPARVSVSLTGNAVPFLAGNTKTGADVGDERAQIAAGVAGA